MDFDKEEEKIVKVLKSLQLNKPPEGLMKNYEQEVLRKVHSRRTGLIAGWPGVLALTFSCLLLGVLVLVARPLLMPKSQPGSATVSMSDPIQNKKDDPLQKIDRDLFILEMLGEDGGLLEDFEPGIADVEFLQQVNISF